jgi:rhodanese-related sulfurtransferase
MKSASRNFILSSHGPRLRDPSVAAFDPVQQRKRCDILAGASGTKHVRGRGSSVPEEEDAMATSVKQMMETANAAVPRITAAEARDMIAKGNTLVVDVRDAPEVEKSGKLAGAVNVSRGMLEFRADPESPYHDKNFARDKTVIVYCASGGRSALSGKVLKDMGYERVYNLGAFKDWAEGGGAIDKPGA